MARRLPPLKALPDFEAAARHLSFTKAAEELHLTHGAVSRQVKALEEHLGVKLFRRLNRALLLTDEGQAYLGTVREVIERLVEAGDRLKKRDEQGGLVVSTTMSFTIKWLVPRLARFRTLHPDIDVRLQAEDRVVDFARDGVDIDHAGTAEPVLEEQRAELIRHVHVNAAVPRALDSVLLSAHSNIRPAVIGMEQLHSVSLRFPVRWFRTRRRRGHPSRPRRLRLARLVLTRSRCS